MDYDKLIAPAAREMRPSGIRKFFDLAAEMPECISLGVGEPDFKTPWAVREAGIESLEHGRTRYTSNAGLKELRAEISRYLERRMNLRYDPMRQILVTVGGSEAIDMCIRTLVKPGDEVIIPEPCFVCYEPITTLSGGVPVHVACRQEDEFRLRAEALKAAITPKTKLVIMPFPNNPTGAVMEREDLEAVAEVLRGTDIMVLSDEIYAELNYGLRPHVSIATLPGMAERTIVVNGFSKSYAMTGWRLGYTIAPPEITDRIKKVHDFLTVGAAAPLQEAVIPGLRFGQEYYNDLLATYTRKRDLFVEGLDAIGLQHTVPQGAYYILMDISEFGFDSDLEFCEVLARDVGVGAVPGSSFFREPVNHLIRFHFAKRDETLCAALNRLETIRKKIPARK
jgi:aminotransferase